MSKCALLFHLINKTYYKQYSETHGIRHWWSCPYTDHSYRTEDALPHSGQHVDRVNTSSTDVHSCIQTQNLDMKTHLLGNLHQILYNIYDTDIVQDGCYSRLSNCER